MSAENTHHSRSHKTYWTVSQKLSYPTRRVVTMDLDLFFQTVWDVLQVDEEACLNVICSTGGWAREAMVSLVEGDLSTTDALAYARTLCDLGRLAEAREVLWAVLRTSFGLLKPQTALLA